MRVRIRWSRAGLALLGVAAGLLGLRVAPSFLTPPSPPPLPDDVGLPRIEAVAKPHEGQEAKGRAGKPSPPAQRSPQRQPKREPRNRARPRTPSVPRQTSPSIVVPPPTASVPEPTSEAPPEAPDTNVPVVPPNDGSMEFAPH